MSLPISARLRRFRAWKRMHNEHLFMPIVETLQGSPDCAHLPIDTFPCRVLPRVYAFLCTTEDDEIERK